MIRAARQSLLMSLFAIFMAFALAACGSDDDDGDNGNNNDNGDNGQKDEIKATFADIKAKIFQKDCAGCHTGGGKQGGLDLDAISFADLTSKKDSKTGKVYITAKNPEESSIFLRITDKAGDGLVMPAKPRAPITDAKKLDALKKWIEAGALEKEAE